MVTVREARRLAESRLLLHDKVGRSFVLLPRLRRESLVVQKTVHVTVTREEVGEGEDYFLLLETAIVSI